MTLPKYRLQPVLDKRQKIKEDAEKALGAAQKELDAEKKKEQECAEAVENAKRAKEEFKAEMNRKMLTENLEINKITMLKNYVKSLEYLIEQAKEKLEQQKVRVKQAEKVVDQKRGELLEATKEFQAIEKHKEKWAEAIKKEMEEAEQKEQEEIGNVLYLQRKQKE
jgi:flagellar export protein FliJ